MLSATLTNHEDGIFTIMYVNEKTQERILVNIKWYASIYRHNYGYHIKYPDGCKPDVKEIYVRKDVASPYTDNGILYLPIDNKSLNYCIDAWSHNHKMNTDYFGNE
jgi:hypothetical protein